MHEDRHPEQDPAEGSRNTIERQLDQPEKSTNHGEGGKKTGIERDAQGQYAKAKKAVTITASSAPNPEW
jgi:hypothetical protein